MAAFEHKFHLREAGKTYRVYKSDAVTARIDFIGESCLRVAVFKSGESRLPGFCVAPDNHMPFEGRDRLSLQGFSPVAPTVTQPGENERFKLPCGVEIEVNLHNFLLTYRLGQEILFADRKPLAYNLEGECGEGSYHYLTRMPGEYIFGVGDKGGALNKAGRAFRIETTDCMGYDASESDPLYKHIPFFICENSVGTYGIFYDTSDTSYLDFGKEINNYYPPYKYFKTEDNCLVYYVFFGCKLSILQQFGALCGKQAFPPRWSFDYTASTMAYTDAPESEKHFDTFLQQLKEHELSCSGFYLSSGYTSIGEQRYVFHWNHEKFPNPKAFVEKFSDNGIAIIPNIKPAFLLSHPLYETIAAKGLFVKNEDGTPFVTEFWDGLGSYLDFTNASAREFWQQQVESTLLDLGMHATWNDNNEFDIHARGALASGFGTGVVPAHRIRPVLTYLMNAASYTAQRQKQPERRPFLSTRSGNIGIRRMAQTWSGDNRTCFEDLRYCHNIGLTMSLSGLHFYGHDVGGFYGEMPSRELLLRWIQHGIFEPRFTIHSWNADGSATMPWSYPDIMPAVKRLFRQRRELLPYLYNCAYRSVEEEIPMNAPPLLYYDDAPLYAQNDTMMVGTDMLVPFVFDEGAEQTAVYLPQGDDWYCGGKRVAGGTEVQMTIRPEDKVPFFAKAGSVIALGENQVRLHVFPLASGSFTARYFEDDGVSYGYQSGACVLLEMRVLCEESTVTVAYSNRGTTPFEPVFVLPAGETRQLILKNEQ